jgi:tellurite resistance protein TehA-like permease
VNRTSNETGRLTSAIANLFPGYFALVMATGIVSVAAFLLDFKPIAQALLYLNIFTYIVLTLMLLARAVLFFTNLRADVKDHVRGPGFFNV